MPPLVDIVTADGQAAAVPEENLSLALSSGAKVAGETPPASPDGGGLLGEAATAVLGAGRTASLGFSDEALGEMANIAGGEQSRKDMLRSIDITRRANPYSNMAGEFAGLFVGGPTALGEAAEGAVAEKVGEGLLGKAAAFGVRGAVEGAELGYQHELTEATLGDHALNGEKVWAGVTKDALLGGALGAGLGVGAGALTSAVEKIRAPRGPIADAALDEIAGVEGAGRLLKEDAAHAEEMVESLRKSGATSEQAARMVDEAMTMSRAKASTGPVSGLVDDVAAQYIAKRAGGNEQMGEVLARGFAERSKRLADKDLVRDGFALNLKKIGDRVLRAEDALNEVQFTYKAEQMAKKVDVARFDAQRDTLAKLLQDTDDVLRFWESTAAKGGAEGAIKGLRKQYTDALDALARVEESGSATASRDFFVRADKFKRAIDSVSQYGKSPSGMPEAVIGSDVAPGLSQIGDKWRYTLEDANVWGEAALAQKEWNATFSQTFPRRQDFGGRFASRIDQERGIPVAELDAEKVKNGLLKKLGSEADAQQALKSTEQWVNGNRDRIAAIRKYGDLTPRQLAALEDGAAALSEFETTLGTARTESEAIARLERMQLEEQGKAIGGLLGFGADLITRPLTTLERLGALRNFTKRTEEAIEGGMRRFFGGKGGPEVVAELKPRAHADIVKDVSEVKKLAANGEALDARAREMVGDLTQYAPKTASEAIATAKRAILWLASEAPPASVRGGVLSSRKLEPHYTEQGLHEWDSKRRAAFEPTTIVRDMKRGKLNREAIRAVEMVSPRLYAEIQRSAQEWVEKKTLDGTIDRMPYQEKAVLASLLKVPADETWKPDFLLMMQAAKAMPPPQPAAATGPQMVTSKRAIKMNGTAWETEAMQIEKR